MYSTLATLLLAAAAAGHEGDGHYVVDQGASYGADASGYVGHCLMPQNCYSPRYGCYPGNSRFLHRYPAFHGYSFRKPYNYRNVFDYPWHAELHEPTSLFAFEVEEQEVRQAPPHAAQVTVLQRGPLRAPISYASQGDAATWSEEPVEAGSSPAETDTVFMAPEREVLVLDEEPVGPSVTMHAEANGARVWKFDAAGLDARDLETLLGQLPAPAPAKDSSVAEAAHTQAGETVDSAVETASEEAPLQPTVGQAERLAELLRNDQTPPGLTIRQRPQESANDGWRARASK